ncbi:MAG: bifunctional phosphopantothenoylcysteine decarboxylase/phosphopantothenate--cysteine ligase CoaBC, partial [Chitinispirillaceae bacterium]|nr:bifunctional phosphopantothenoylcysteine decarboxylase/phosphopantothenate--cysteine ligase CoaBC [Chitinispirillaceae bacterium]
AMNSAMFENPITQENINILKKRGFTILPTILGELACGKEGYGRMIEIDEIAESILSNLSKSKLLSGKKVLISAGATEEPIDPVRVISNRSSGKMGMALISEALNLGAEVTAVIGKVIEPVPENVTIIKVTTAEEMENALIKEFDSSDICIMSAAVSDYRAKNIFKEKIHRELTENLTIELIPNNDILQSLGRIKKHQILVGFALEEKMDKESAIIKMKKKNCDIMVLNSIDNSLGTDTTIFSIFDKAGKENSYNKMSKREAAKIIFSKILELLEK